MFLAGINLLVWNEGEIVYVKSIGSNSDASAYRFKPGRTISLPFEARIQLYTMTPLDGGKSVIYGFGRKDLVTPDSGARHGYARLQYCGDANSDAPDKVRALRALKAERWPKSADAK